MKYLLISDTHSNLEALEAVMGAADFDRLVFLGDAVDYGPDPEAVVDVLKSAAKSGGVLVRGNHDEAAASDPGGVDRSWWSEVAFATLEYTWGRLSAADRAFLGGLPLTAPLDLGAGGRALCAHGSPSDNRKYLWPDAGDAELAEALLPAARGYDAVWVGHTHLPFHRQVRGTLVVNPGSVGQPRDGDWKASCATFDTEEASLHFMRVEYDLDQTVRKIRDRGMPLADALVSVLRTGGGLRAGGGP
jgi:predicted phosphodiesterase